VSETVTAEPTCVNENYQRRFIKPAVFRFMLGDISAMTEWRVRQRDPDFPAHHPTFGYLFDEAVAYIERKAAERNGR
jgi:hypothetical protein